MRYAHITKINGGYSLQITESTSPKGGIVFLVADKRDARAKAREHGATPWNF